MFWELIYLLVFVYNHCPHTHSFYLSCRADNDLYRVLRDSGIACFRYDLPAEAVQQAPENAGVLILADDYPEKTTALEADIFETALVKKLRLYVEYPALLPDMKLDKPRHTNYERGVIVSDIFEPTLEKMRITTIHDCHFVPVTAEKVHMVVAKVAGFDTAVYGLPDEGVWPILFEHPEGNLLVSTTKLSQFVTARYSPKGAWQVIWKTVLGWLRPGKTIPDLQWTLTVRASHGRDEPLPDDIEFQAFRRAIEWHKRSGLMVRAPWKDKGIGNGRFGMEEGYSSSIRFDGTQRMRRGLRSDNMGEESMVMAFGGELLNDSSYSDIAANLNDFIYFDSDLTKGACSDPNSPTYGLVKWVVGGEPNQSYFALNQARMVLGTMAAAALLNTDRWDEPVMRNLLANIRLSGKFGFQANAYRHDSIQEKGWPYFFNKPVVNYRMYTSAPPLAAYLWAYHQTGYKLFLDQAKTAISMAMQAYPDQWRWATGIQPNRARMILPLAWLVRVEDTSEHRQWLRTMVRDILKLQDASGAIPEVVFSDGRGSCPPPKSNEEYAKRESSLIQRTGDPVCDLMYCAGFAFIGIHEAAMATGEQMFIDAEEKLAKFFCRVQVCSENHPELDGVWFRAFDFKRWEYWASNADCAWGAWCIETGWGQSWITSVLALRQMETSLWDLTADSNIEKHFEKYRRMMLPDKVVKAHRGCKINHLALGRPVKLKNPYDSRYPASGNNALTDGYIASEKYWDDWAWQGFLGSDLNATIDLGKEMNIKQIKSRYQQYIKMGIFFPSSVEYAVSSEGKTFRPIATLTHDISTKHKDLLVKTFVAEVDEKKVRYLRVHAKNIGINPANDRKAWLFVDEILVE